MTRSTPSLLALAAGLSLAACSGSTGEPTDGDTPAATPSATAGPGTQPATATAAPATDTPGAATAAPTATPTATQGIEPTDEPRTATPTSPETTVPPAGSRGLTYGFASQDAELGTVTLGCNQGGGSCDPFYGDTACTQALPILCIGDKGQPNPATVYAWSGGALEITEPVRGDALPTLAAADSLCATFGEGWRMAEWHDYGSGQNLSGYGTFTTDSRVWVFIDDQPRANCFPLPGSETPTPGASTPTPALPTPTATDAPTPTPTLAPTPTPTLAPTPEPTPDPRKGGLTYSIVSRSAADGAMTVGCYGEQGTCDPYYGDVLCSEPLPLLCIVPNGAQAPADLAGSWVGGKLMLSPPILGNTIGGFAQADQICEDSFGQDARYARFHDNPQGFKLSGQGAWDSDQPFWVGIADEPGNCWDAYDAEGSARALVNENLPGKAGVTYDWLSRDESNNTVATSCFGAGNCNPTAGDTGCSRIQPLLCISDTGAPAPAGATHWAGGSLALSPPFQGSRFDTIGDANKACLDTFGSGWRVAEWHDYAQGRYLTGFGQWRTDVRFWVDVNDQSANCWARNN